MDPKHFTLLRIHDACRGLSNTEIEAIAARAEVVHAEAGSFIHRHPQRLDSLYLVLQGMLKMMLKTPGGQQQTFRYIGSGDQFGALMLVADDGFPVDVEVDDTAILLRLDREIAAQLADQFPMFRRNILRKIGGGLRDSLLKQSKRSQARLVAFIHADKSTRMIVAEIAQRLSAIGEKIGVICDAQDHSFGPSIPQMSLVDSNGDYVSKHDVQNFVVQNLNLSRIFIVLDEVHVKENLLRLVELADMVFCISSTIHSDRTINELKGLIQRWPSWQKKMHFVWVLAEHEQVAPFIDELPKLVERDFKIQLTDPPSATRLYEQGIERIIHHLRDVRIGVALSGGAARGMSHLGALKALEEARITIDVLAGTSAGVLTGVICAAGYTPDFAIQHFTEDLEPGSIYKKLPKGDEIYMLKQYRSQAWDQMLRKYTGDWRLEQFPLPVHTVTTDLVSARCVVRSSGDAIDALLESINLPVLSPPICRDGMLLVDGGLLNNLPADVLVKLGCNLIIGVDVSANIEHRLGNNFPDTPTEKMKSPGVVATLLRCLNVQAHNLSGQGAHCADVIIAPDVTKIDSAAFTRTPELAEIGYRTTMEALPRIREVLHNLDRDLFSK